MSQLEVQISEELCRQLVMAMGCDFDDERIKRMAADTRRLVALGLGGAKSAAEAFENELLLYGDPRVTDQVVGILNTT